MKLNEVAVGERARVLHVSGDDAVKRHLGALGFVAGALVRVSGSSYGNIILAIHESRIALDEATAMLVEVDRA